MDTAIFHYKVGLEIEANRRQNASSDDFGSNFVSKLRSFRHEFNAEIAASESMDTRLTQVNEQFLDYVIGTGPGNCMCIVHCIASHCVKCRTFLFETENNKDLRSTISQERLDGLALLAIENEAAKQHNTYDLL